MPLRGAASASACGAGAADMVPVFGDIGEVREKAEGADGLQRLARRQAVQRLFERAPGFGILITMKADRVLPNAFNGVEHRFAALLAHRVTEYPPEQPDIVAQLPVLVVGIDRVRFRHRTALLRANGSCCPVQKPCRSATGPPPHPLACFVHIRGLHRRA